VLAQIAPQQARATASATRVSITSMVIEQSGSLNPLRALASPTFVLHGNQIHSGTGAGKLGLDRVQTFLGVRPKSVRYYRGPRVGTLSRGP
jgi:hypothetical protein